MDEQADSGDVPERGVELDLESQLNSVQREAVLHGDGPLLVFAGAGSGKTRVITYRIAHLVGVLGVAPWQILAVTFTNKAAGEMRERVQRLLAEDARGMWISTFHSMCLRILRRDGDRVGLQAGFSVYDATEQMQLLRRVLEAHARYDRVDARTIRSRIDQAKNRGIGPDDFVPGDWLGDIVARLYPLYQGALRKANAVDFSDLLMLALRLLRENDDLRSEYQHRFRYILVDEFQDTNRVQYDIVRQLTAAPHNLTVVGDDDQSIYGWRGAELGNILGFPSHFPKARVVLLEENYRSTANILQAASAVVARNLERRPKTLFTSREDGSLLTWLELDDEWREAHAAVEALQALIVREGYDRKACAFFVRVGAQTRVLEEALRMAAVPHVVVGAMRFYERAEIRDALAYLRILVNPADEVNLERIINKPARGIGRTTLESLKALAALRGWTLWQAIVAAGEGEGKIRSAGRKRLREFCALVAELRALAEAVSPAETLLRTLDRSRYLEALEKDGSVEAEGRLENLSELVTAVREFQEARELEHPDDPPPSLMDYLEGVALQSDQDTLTGDDRLPVLTVHAAKGLEFDAVFLIGMEDGIFPHNRSLEEPGRLEEERRLAYVAITRARHYLFFTTARRRSMAGRSSVNPPSRYLRDIPVDLIHRPLARLEPTGRRHESVPDDADSSWLDRSESQLEPDEVGAGARVRHARFGVGQVEWIRGDRVTVRFEDGTVKTIISSHLELA